MNTNMNGNMVMPVAPYGNGYGGGDGMLGTGGGWMWFLLVWMAMFGWGGNGFNGNGGRGAGINAEVQAGFDHQAVMSGLNGIVPAIQNGFAQAEVAANARQIAGMNQMFGIQSAIQQGDSDLRAGTADLKYTVANEGCADRNAISNGIRDVMENCNRNNQAIMDKLNALELDGVKNQLAAAQRENLGLQNQLNMANLAASQTAQNSQIVDSIYERLSSCPVGTMPVYGNQPIFTCPQNRMGFGCSGYAAA